MSYPISSAGAPPVAAPATVGWSAAAIAVRSILQISTPLLLRLVPQGHEPIYIDFRHHAFLWPTPISAFPAIPLSVDVETEPVPEGAPPLFDPPGQNLDNLLWPIGLNAFGGQSASWLRPNDRYRLKRWPNFTEMNHTVEQMRMTALLGTVALTPEELADAVGADVRVARQLVNALSLMDILLVSNVVAAPAEAAPETRATLRESATSRDSLFSRLRKRIGG